MARKIQKPKSPAPPAPDGGEAVAPPARARRGAGKGAGGSAAASKPGRPPRSPAARGSISDGASAVEPEVLGPEDESDEDELQEPAPDALEEAAPDALDETGETPAAQARARSALPVGAEEEEDAELEEEPDASATALSRSDPLRRYMQEVARHPVLSREEEHRLAVHYRDTGDLGAAYKLVASNLRLVVKIAYEYRRAAFNVLDLIQEGNVGLMHAVKKYDPYKGVKLSSYAAWWIRAYILRFVMDNWRMVKLGTTQAQRKLFFNLRKEQQKLASEGYEVGPKLLAERLQVSEQEIEEMDRRLSGDETSIDTPVGDEGGSTFGDRLAQAGTGADDALGNAELRAILRRNLEKLAATLEGKDRFIFEQRMMAEEPLTLQEIGDRFGISRERARQLEARLVKRLREQMAAELPDFEDLSLEGKD